MPQTFEDVVELLIPELRRRSLFWEDYCVPGATYRENLYERPGQSEPLSDHPALKMLWRPDGVNGIAASDTNGEVNGYMESHKKVVVDPMSTQIN